MNYWDYTDTDCDCGMNNGEICEGDGHVTGYGHSSNLDNCGDYDIFTCVEDTEGNVLEFSKLLCPIFSSNLSGRMTKDILSFFSL